MGKVDHFSPVVTEKLQCYVYRLVDPRTGVTFYVGRGRGNRVFSHAAGEEKFETPEEAKSMKMDWIRDIQKDNFQVEHVIHRHGMNEETAKEVEAALIDAYPGLTNIQSGHDSLRKAMHAKQIIQRYEPEEANFKHKVILIKIDRSLKKDPMIKIENAVRYAWKISVSRARKADYVLAVSQGIIVGAYIARDWRLATRKNFPEFPHIDPDRFGFSTSEAPGDVKAMYIGKLAPKLKHGAAFPIQYLPKTPWK